MRYRILTAAGAAGLWLILWRDVSVANVVTGLVLGAAASTFPSRDRMRHRLRPVAFARFLAHFTANLVESNLQLAREILTIRNTINTGIIAVPLPVDSNFVVTLTANVVSLTPGTLTLEATGVPEPVLYVHVLHLRDIDRARADILRTAELASAAFPVVGPVSSPAGEGAP